MTKINNQYKVLVKTLPRYYKEISSIISQAKLYLLRIFPAYLQIF